MELYPLLPSTECVLHTAIVQVLRVEHSTMQANIVVPQWNNNVCFQIPLSMIPEELYGNTIDSLQGKFLLANVNTNAESVEDLCFENFRDAGPIPSDDELGF